MNAINFNYFGKGKKTLILFPGWTHPAQNEPAFIKKLSKKYKVISVNLPGYADNKDSASLQNFLLLAKNFHAKLQEEHITPSAFIGFSMGCRFITTYSTLYPNTIPCVFIGFPTSPYELPHWARIIITNPSLLRVFRSNKQFITFAVNKAFKHINQDSTAMFNSKTVTFLGAFDSLIGLLMSDVNLNKHQHIATFIYGENDGYLEGAQLKNIKAIVIKNATHNCVHGHEDEMVNIISKSIS